MTEAAEIFFAVSQTQYRAEPRAADTSAMLILEGDLRCRP